VADAIGAGPELKGDAEVICAAALRELVWCSWYVGVFYLLARPTSEQLCFIFYGCCGEECGVVHGLTRVEIAIHNYTESFIEEPMK